MSPGRGVPSGSGKAAHRGKAGPGKVLCGLMRQIDRSRTCLNVEDEASLQKTAGHFVQA